jgi:hypothetical protein
MPPYATNRTIWHGINRQVFIREDTTGTRAKCAVVVTFTKVGYANDTQERVEEQISECVLAVG